MLKLKGKPREVFNSTTGKTEWSQYPVDRQGALLEGVARYFMPEYTCPTHGERTIFFTTTGIAACCANREAARAYSEALAAGEPMSVGDASNRGLNYYWATPQVNPYCGHSSKFTLKGKCAFCETQKEESPRKVALAAGEVWYTPLEGDHCPKGHHAPRRVATGSCKQCEEDAKTARKLQRSATPQPIYRSNPNMVISRENAKALGFTVYRTGEPCSRGHVGWRYVSTLGCIDCLRDR